MSGDLHVLLQILVMAAVTALLRFLPFWIFRDGERRSGVITYLGAVLPYAVMGMLVVYCLKNVSLLTAPHGIPEAIALLAVAALHLWRRSTLLSIFGGTAVYMLLAQVVFV